MSKIDYGQPWVLGWQHVDSEGSDLIAKTRKANGLSRGDVYKLSDHVLDPNTQGLIEGDYGAGMVTEISHLVYYALIFNMTPGELLDMIFNGPGIIIFNEERERIAELKEIEGDFQPMDLAKTIHIRVTDQGEIKVYRGSMPGIMSDGLKEQVVFSVMTGSDPGCKLRVQFDFNFNRNRGDSGRRTITVRTHNHEKTEWFLDGQPLTLLKTRREIP